MAVERQKISLPVSVAAALDKSSLPAPYDTPPDPEALRPSPATVNLVKSQINALLTSSPSFHHLRPEEKRRFSEDLTKIAAYSAELIRDDWYQSERIGQHPVVRKKEIIETPVVRAQATADDGFETSAANRIGRVTKETLNAISFPTFVADLIQGSFNAIVQSSIHQMEAYLKLVENVSKTVDQFMRDNITDNQAKDYLAQSYPDHITIKEGNAIPRDDAAEKPPPNFQGDLNLPQNVDVDESSIEEVLIPAARRKLAQTRHQMLSTMVLMGINRIVVTGGKIRATMGFHIDTTDRLQQEKATDLDFRASAAGSFGFGPWSVSASTSVSYVSSSRQKSDSEMNVDANLTGEVEIHFKSDYFPLNRFADTAAIGRIQSHTAVPENNPPGENAVDRSEPFSQPPAVGDTVGKFATRRAERPPLSESLLPKTPAALPPARMPEKPVAPDDIHPVVKRDEKQEQKTETKVESGGEKEAVKETETKAEAGETKKEETPTEGEKKEEQPTEGEKKTAEEKPEKPAGENTESGAETDSSPGEGEKAKESEIKEKAKKAVGEVGETIKEKVGEKAGDFVKDLIGGIGK
ncbi:MAG: hypothetical protein R2747_07280 [Pyrinomonadaceae bacterium]